MKSNIYFKRICYPIFVFTPLFLLSQVGINTVTPDGSAILDVVSTTKGVLLPRMSTVQRNSILNPSTGLLVFDNDINKFFGYNGAQWTQDVFGTTKWATSGNSNTNPNTDFLGTTDNTSLSFRTNNQQAMLINSSGAVSIDGGNLNAPRLFVGRSNAGTSYPSILATVNNDSTGAYPVNIIISNNSGTSGRIQGNYAFSFTNPNAGNTIGGIIYSRQPSLLGSEGIVFYTGGHPANHDDQSKDAMIIGANKNVYIGYGSFSSLPSSKLNIAGGDIYLSAIGSGVVMTSPNGTCYKVSIDNTGVIQTISITCP